MGDYPNQNKLQNIKSISPQEMSLGDGSKWRFLDATPPPLLWQAGDQVIIETTEGGIKSEVMYRVINKTRKDQDRPAVYLGGGASKEQIIEMNKSLKDYPDERLERDLRIEKLLEDSCILLEEGSVWQLTNPTLQNEGEWDRGQYVRISKGPSRIKNYQITNLKINKTFFAIFMGFIKSEW